jgi:light-regulated signal transduction histidine kinase (bacteriophytochrome)
MKTKLFCRSENVTFYFTKLNFKCFTSHKTRRKINVTAKANEDKLIIKVKDNGVGMSEKTTKNLLPHKWLSKTRAENKGAGIGLLLVRGF